MTDSAVKPASRRRADTSTAPEAGAAPSADAIEPTEQQPRQVIVAPGRMELREMRHNDWRGLVPPGTTAEDLHHNGQAFSLCANMLTLGDQVMLFTEDAKTLFRLVCVRGDRGTSAMCAVTDVIQLPDQQLESDDLPDGYVIRKATVGEEQEGWLVVRTADGHVLNYGSPLYSRSEAKTFLSNHATQRFRVGTVGKPVQRHTMS